MEKATLPLLSAMSDSAREAVYSLIGPEAWATLESAQQESSEAVKLLDTTNTASSSIRGNKISTKNRNAQEQEGPFDEQEGPFDEHKVDEEQERDAEPATSTIVDTTAKEADEHAIDTSNDTCKEDQPTVSLDAAVNASSSNRPCLVEAKKSMSGAIQEMALASTRIAQASQELATAMAYASSTERTETPATFANTNRSSTSCAAKNQVILETKQASKVDTHESNKAVSVKEEDSPPTLAGEATTPEKSIVVTGSSAELDQSAQDNIPEEAQTASTEPTVCSDMTPPEAVVSDPVVVVFEEATSTANESADDAVASVPASDADVTEAGKTVVAPVIEAALTIVSHDKVEADQLAQDSIPEEPVAAPPEPTVCTDTTPPEAVVSDPVVVVFEEATSTANESADDAVVSVLASDAEVTLAGKTSVALVGEATLTIVSHDKVEADQSAQDNISEEPVTAPPEPTVCSDMTPPEAVVSDPVEVDFEQAATAACANADDAVVSVQTSYADVKVSGDTVVAPIGEATPPVVHAAEPKHVPPKSSPTSTKKLSLSDEPTIVLDDKVETDQSAQDNISEESVTAPTEPTVSSDMTSPEAVVSDPVLVVDEEATSTADESANDAVVSVPAITVEETVAGDTSVAPVGEAALTIVSHDKVEADQSAQDNISEEPVTAPTEPTVCSDMTPPEAVVSDPAVVVDEEATSTANESANDAVVSLPASDADVTVAGGTVVAPSEEATPSVLHAMEPKHVLPKETSPISEQKPSLSDESTIVLDDKLETDQSAQDEMAEESVTAPTEPTVSLDMTPPEPVLSDPVVFVIEEAANAACESADDAVVSKPASAVDVAVTCETAVAPIGEVVLPVLHAVEPKHVPPKESCPIPAQKPSLSDESAIVSDDVAEVTKSETVSSVQEVAVVIGKESPPKPSVEHIVAEKSVTASDDVGTPTKDTASSSLAVVDLSLEASSRESIEEPLEVESALDAKEDSGAPLVKADEGAVPEEPIAALDEMVNTAEKDTASLVVESAVAAEDDSPVPVADLALAAESTGAPTDVAEAAEGRSVGDVEESAIDSTDICDEIVCDTIKDETAAPVAIVASAAAPESSPQDYEQDEVVAIEDVSAVPMVSLETKSSTLSPEATQKLIAVKSPTSEPGQTINDEIKDETTVSVKDAVIKGESIVIEEPAVSLEDKPEDTASLPVEEDAITEKTRNTEEPTVNEIVEDKTEVSTSPPMAETTVTEIFLSTDKSTRMSDESVEAITEDATLLVEEAETEVKQEDSTANQVEEPVAVEGPSVSSEETSNGEVALPVKETTPIEKFCAGVEPEHVEKPDISADSATVSSEIVKDVMENETPLVEEVEDNGLALSIDSAREVDDLVVVEELADTSKSPALAEAIDVIEDENDASTTVADPTINTKEEDETASAVHATKLSPELDEQEPATVNNASVIPYESIDEMQHEVEPYIPPVDSMSIPLSDETIHEKDAQLASLAGHITSSPVKAQSTAVASLDNGSVSSPDQGISPSLSPIPNQSSTVIEIDEMEDIIPGSVGPETTEHDDHENMSLLSEASQHEDDGETEEHNRSTDKTATTGSDYGPDSYGSLNQVTVAGGGAWATSKALGLSDAPRVSCISRGGIDLANISFFEKNRSRHGSGKQKSIKTFLFLMAFLLLATVMCTTLVIMERAETTTSKAIEEPAKPKGVLKALQHAPWFSGIVSGRHSLE